jgi:hypothetical protein
MFLSSFKSSFITKNLVLIFKLNTIEIFYYKDKDFAIILVFLGSYHSLGKVVKEDIYICVCVCCNREHVNI